MLFENVNLAAFSHALLPNQGLIVRPEQKNIIIIEHLTCAPDCAIILAVGCGKTDNTSGSIA